jgi:hypothetical protein
MLVSARALAHLPRPNPAAATSPKCSWDVLLARAGEVAESLNGRWPVSHLEPERTSNCAWSMRVPARNPARKS